MDVGCVGRLKYIMCKFCLNQRQYGKFLLSPSEFGWLNYVGKQYYESILTGFVKKNIGKRYEYDHNVNFGCITNLRRVWIKTTVNGLCKSLLRGKPMFMGSNGTFSSIMERKEDKYIFWKLAYEF